MKNRSVSNATKNLTLLKELFPEVIAEGENGAVVDVDILKRLIGDQTVTDVQEKYGLDWCGKRHAQQFASMPSLGTLQPYRDESVNWDTTKNIMIEGDNLEVLKILRKSYTGKVKLIYIDPPYNTGHDFTYSDNFQNTAMNYNKLTRRGSKQNTNLEFSARYHTNWLNMMYPRLKLAKELLTDDGIIAISIDHHELANLNGILVDLFGEENAVNTFVWVNNIKGRQTSTHGAVLTHEYIVVWSKNKKLVKKFMIPISLAVSKFPGEYKPHNFKYKIRCDSTQPISLTATPGPMILTQRIMCYKHSFFSYDLRNFDIVQTGIGRY